MSIFLNKMNMRYDYLFTGGIWCLVFRITIILQFNEKIGPLFKIVGKLLMEFLNFSFVYFIFIVMFGILGNINFMNDLDVFEGTLQSFITVVNYSLGNLNSKVFDPIKSEGLVMFGEIYIMALQLIFNVLLINFMIAILSNIY